MISRLLHLRALVCVALCAALGACSDGDGPAFADAALDVVDARSDTRDVLPDVAVDAADDGAEDGVADVATDTQRDDASDAPVETVETPVSTVPGVAIPGACVPDAPEASEFIRRDDARAADCWNECAVPESVDCPSCLEGRGYPDDCTACIGDFAACALTECAACEDASSDDCSACAVEACGAGFLACAGLSAAGAGALVPPAAYTRACADDWDAPDDATLWTYSDCIDDCAPSDAACQQQCAADGLGASDACGTCVGSFNLCASLWCEDACEEGVVSERCSACATPACGATFEVCAGIDPADLVAEPRPTTRLLVIAGHNSPTIATLIDSQTGGIFGRVFVSGRDRQIDPTVGTRTVSVIAGGDLTAPPSSVSDPFTLVADTPYSALIYDTPSGPHFAISDDTPGDTPGRWRLFHGSLDRDSISVVSDDSDLRWTVIRRGQFGADRFPDAPPTHLRVISPEAATVEFSLPPFDPSLTIMLWLHDRANGDPRLFAVSSDGTYTEAALLE